ncbi:MOSC and FAD-binding oxidoreductase domain-containing protein [Luteibacter yeojuensis]|uniref:nitric oxide dioxygenase n=1 Tax=Luteibacter yeojuensis TaxID=345309 RepID=A0A7X5QSE7_9GAMM|nr:MOSC and FAD-binding oxidoreductase domain-containing protein [Luteibacter yeojuensis]NID14563.1 MOSC domain-containing protein [Luteibacter yeojuensis]
MASVLSVNVGLPRDVEWEGRIVRTGIFKAPVPGRVMVRTLNIDGDGQADKAGHGGPNRAVMVYQIESYRYWEAFLERPPLDYGQFGENLTIEGLPDNEVRIGDRYRIGGALFEVTQPRVTCYRVGIRMNHPQMASLLVAHHRPGFYFRVIEEGEIGAGDTIEKVSQGPEDLTVADVDALLYLPGHSRDALERALRIPALSPGWKQSFAQMLEDEARPKASTQVAPAWNGYRDLVVESVRRESDAVSSFVLVSADGTSLPPPVPGQFLALRVDRGADLPPILRSYSISGYVPGRSYRISVKRAEGEGSRFLHDHVTAGQRMEASAPRGQFALVTDGSPVILASAGIGITPLLSMLRALTAEPAPRAVWWIHCARRGSEDVFAEEVRETVAKLPDARATVFYSRPAEDDRKGRDYDIAGRIDRAQLEGMALPSDGHYYLCGPQPFMRQMLDDLHELGVPGERIHSETFGPEAAITPGTTSGTGRAPHPPAAEGTGPMVTFSRSGLSVRWDPRFGSLLELAEACDVAVRWSCRTGVCHTCQCGLVDGAVAYAPDPLTPPPDGDVLICCSAPRGAVSLDL